MRIAQRIAMALGLLALAAGQAAAQASPGEAGADPYPVVLRADRDFLASKGFAALVEALGGQEDLAKITESIAAHRGLLAGIRETAFLAPGLEKVDGEDLLLVLSYGASPAAALEADSRPYYSNSNADPQGMRVLELGGDPLYAFAEGTRIYGSKSPESLYAYWTGPGRPAFAPLAPGTFAATITVTGEGSLGKVKDEGIASLGFSARFSAVGQLVGTIDLAFTDEALVQPYYDMVAGAAQMLRGVAELPSTYTEELYGTLPASTRGILALFRDLRAEKGPLRVSLTFTLDPSNLATLSSGQRL